MAQMPGTPLLGTRVNSLFSRERETPGRVIVSLDERRPVPSAASGCPYPGRRAGPGATELACVYVLQSGTSSRHGGDLGFAVGYLAGSCLRCATDTTGG